MATSSGGGETPLKPQAQPPKPTSEATPTPENQKLQPLDSSPNPVTPPNPTSAPPIPTTDSKQTTTPATVNSRPRETYSVPDSDVIHVPSYSSKPMTRFTLFSIASVVITMRLLEIKSRVSSCILYVVLIYLGLIAGKLDKV